MNVFQLAGPDLRSLRRFEIAGPGQAASGKVLVRMRAASLNFIDYAVAHGLFHGAAFPLVPVADGAGEIVAVGEGVQGFEVGERVAIHPKLRWHAGRGNADQQTAMRGVTEPGSLIEISHVDAASLVKAPAHLSWEQLAALPICATTAWNAMKAGGVGPSSSVVLLGTGGVSVFALQLAKAAGARVIITSSSDEKLRRAADLGADETINYVRETDWDERVIELSGGKGADLVVETGGSATFRRSLNAVRQAGCVFTVGFVSGSTVELDLLSIISKAVRVVGNNTGSAADFSEAMAVITAHAIEPVIDRQFGMQELEQAYVALGAGGHFGKLALTIDW